MCDWEGVGAPGERLEVIIMSASVKQAHKIREYLSGMFNRVPALRKMIANETGEMLSLKNGIDIEPRPASYRTVRGSTAVCAIGDEVAFWYDEASRNPAEEILAAVRPNLMTAHGLLAVISSPYARRGVLYESFTRDYGEKGNPRVLVARAPSKRMNPLLDDEDIALAYASDPARAACEYGAEWRGDLEAFISIDMLEPCVAPVAEIPYSPMQTYRAFVDPSGGRNDSFTMAIGHAAGEVIVVDHLTEIQPPFRPSQAWPIWSRS